MILPYTRRGYAVEVDTGTVHNRYAQHEGQTLVRTYEAGVWNILKGREPVLCEECFPAPTPPKARKAKAPAAAKAKAKPAAAPLPGGGPNTYPDDVTDAELHPAATQLEPEPVAVELTVPEPEEPTAAS